MGGKSHPKLNIDPRPIANKYCEGKVKRALRRGLKVPETAREEANESSPPLQDCFPRVEIGVVSSSSRCGSYQCLWGVSLVA
jgi:hypothetical protein